MFPILPVENDVECLLLSSRVLLERLTVVRLPQNVIFLKAFLDLELGIGLPEMGERPAFVASVNPQSFTEHFYDKGPDFPVGNQNVTEGDFAGLHGSDKRARKELAG